jgi:hypothetical protein
MGYLDARAGRFGGDSPRLPPYGAREYDHPWMMAAYEARCSRTFCHGPSTERKKMFHEVVFEVG